MKKIVISPFFNIVAFTTMIIAVMHVQAAQASICVNPQNESERVVCGSAELKIIEELISKSYFDKKATLSPMEQQEIERDQKLWRSFLKNCKSDKNCLRDAFNQRLTEIQDFDKVIEKKEDEMEEGEEESEEDDEALEEDEAAEEAKGAKTKGAKAKGAKASKKSKKSKKSSKDKSTKKSKQSKNKHDKKAEAIEPEADADADADADTEDEESALDTEDKDKNLSFMQRFSNWLFPKVKVKENETVSEPALEKSSALMKEDKLTSNYITYQSDLESGSKTPKGAEQANEMSDGEKSDFETNNDLVEEGDNANGSDLAADNTERENKAPNNNESDVATEQTEKQNDEAAVIAKTDETAVAPVEVQVTENEEEQPSFFSRLFSFFSFGDDSKKAAEQTETAIAEGGAPDVIMPEDEQDNNEKDAAENLGDLASATADTDLKVSDIEAGASLDGAEKTEVAPPKQAALKGKTVQKPFVQEAHQGTNRDAETQPVVKPRVSIFTKIADFFSPSPKSVEQGHKGTVKNPVVIAEQSPAAQQMDQTETATAANNNSPKLAQDQGSDLAKSTQPKENTPSEKEQTPSLFNRIAGFFSSKPKTAEETKPSIAANDHSETEMAQAGSDLAASQAQEQQGGALNDEQQGNDQAAQNVTVAGDEDESKNAASETEELITKARPAADASIVRRIANKSKSISNSVKRRNRANRAKRANAARVRKARAKRVARQRAKRKMRRLKKRYSAKVLSAAKASKRKARKRAQKGTRRLVKHQGRKRSLVAARHKSRQKQQQAKYYAPGFKQAHNPKPRAKRIVPHVRTANRNAMRVKTARIKSARRARLQKPVSQKRFYGREISHKAARYTTRQNLKRAALARTVRRVHYKPVYVRKDRARVAQRQRFYRVERCVRCVRCTDCSKPRFRLKHHLREYY